MDPYEEQVAKALEPILRRFRKLHPLEQINTAKVINDALHDAEAEIALARRAAVRQLRQDGWTLQDIGTETDMTPSRVMQLEKGIDRKMKLGKA